MFYRIKQFYWSVTAKLSDNDINFVDRYLDEYEKGLFYKLRRGEQVHCVRVAKDMFSRIEKSYENMDLKKMMKIALLHDIGKINANLSPIDKGILVILNKITGGRTKKLSNRNNKIDVFYNHGQIGAELLKGHIKDESILRVISEHHDYSKNDIESVLLRGCDDLN